MYTGDDLNRQITRKKGDIAFVLDRIKEIKGREPQLPNWLRALIRPPAKTNRKNPRGSGRHKTLKTLRDELRTLGQLSSYLHAEWIRMRGDEVFATGSGADKLAAMGIISAPQIPAYGKRGPKNLSMLHAKLSKFYYEECALKGNRITHARANGMAETVIQAVAKPSFKISPQNACRARRKLQN